MNTISQLLQLDRPIDSIGSLTIVTIWGFPINNSTLFSLLMLILLAFFCFRFFRNISQIPSVVQTVAEMVYEGIETLILRLTGSRKQSDFLLPVIGPLVIYIAMANLMALLPLLGSITYDGKPLLRTPTADYSTTLGLAILAIVAIQFFSIKDYGVFGHFGKFFKFKPLLLSYRGGATGIFIGFIDFFIGFLDIITEFARMISISLRLFGNTYAGMVLSVVASAGVAYVLPSFFLVTGLLFSVVQAVVFGSLVTVYYVLSVKTPAEDEYPAGLGDT